MNIFQYLILLGIIIIVFKYTWNWLFVLPVSLLFAATKFVEGVILLKILGAYFTVSLIVLGTTFALDGAENDSARILFPLLGFLIVSMIFAKQYYETGKNIEENTEDFSRIEALRDLRTDYGIMFIAPLFFFLAMLIPALVDNSINEWLFYTIGWIYSPPVIGLLLGIWGMLYMISILYNILLVIVSLKDVIRQGFMRVKNVNTEWFWFAILVLIAIVTFDYGSSNEYSCTDDCSGHIAGYEWAENKDIDDKDDCGGYSDSFIEGCWEYVEDYY